MIKILNLTCPICKSKLLLDNNEDQMDSNFNDSWIGCKDSYHAYEYYIYFDLSEKIEFEFLLIKQVMICNYKNYCTIQSLDKGEIKFDNFYFDVTKNDLEELLVLL